VSSGEEDEDDLDALIERLPEVMRGPFRDQDPIFAREMAVTFLDASDETKADIEAFFASDGPRRFREHKLKHEDGTPTSDELEGWMS
jgi:hypothetical protein